VHGQWDADWLIDWQARRGRAHDGRIKDTPRSCDSSLSLSSAVETRTAEPKPGHRPLVGRCPRPRLARRGPGCRHAPSNGRKQDDIGPTDRHDMRPAKVCKHQCWVFQILALACQRDLLNKSSVHQEPCDAHARNIFTEDERSATISLEPSRTVITKKLSYHKQIARQLRTQYV